MTRYPHAQEPVPRRLDIDESCARIYINDLRSRGLKPQVYLNGEPVERVLAYDVNEGFVKRQKLKDGRPYVEPGQDRAATEVVRGKVTVFVEDIQK